MELKVSRERRASSGAGQVAQWRSCRGAARAARAQSHLSRQREAREKLLATAPARRGERGAKSRERAEQSRSPRGESPPSLRERCELPSSCRKPRKSFSTSRACEARLASLPGSWLSRLLRRCRGGARGASWGAAAPACCGAAAAPALLSAAAASAKLARARGWQPEQGPRGRWLAGLGWHHKWHVCQLCS